MLIKPTYSNTFVTYLSVELEAKISMPKVIVYIKSYIKGIEKVKSYLKNYTNYKKL